MAVRVTRLVNHVVLVTILFSGTYVAGQVESSEIAYIRTSNHQARLDYLGKAAIWQDPGRKTPEDILNGQPGRFPFDFAEATSAEGEFRDRQRTHFEALTLLGVLIQHGDRKSFHPRISEQGRQFLLEQLKRLDDAHLEALFAVAQVEVLGDENRYEDPDTGTVHTGIDAWVTVFKKKVKEIEEKRCNTF